MGERSARDTQRHATPEARGDGSAPPGQRAAETAPPDEPSPPDFRQVLVLLMVAGCLLLAGTAMALPDGNGAWALEETSDGVPVAPAGWTAGGRQFGPWD